MIDRGIKKSIVCSWIEVKNEVYVFFFGDIIYFMCDVIYAELERVIVLVIEVGYVFVIGIVFYDVEDDEKIYMVCSYSERLVIVFGFISIYFGIRFFIIKNIRICEDCYVFIKFVSRVI